MNGNGKKKIFDINAMNMEATVLEQGSYGVCSSNSGIVTFANEFEGYLDDEQYDYIEEELRANRKK
ncbi:hypothetical protein [Clostridium sp. HBUAS56010]|uniref:hypothetical protein n=1 Tax=Clostridium sp. HBUAS56010 TaxID=2571127 RepID=UPI001178B2E9|nr:hypothetical protein [Clostridium sp. HBUAS56010]